LQRLGRVLHVSQSRNIIITIENLPKIGEAVVNENLKPIGKILDIFGPVSSPYASVKPTIQEIEKLTDKILYVLPSKRRKGKI
jgi:RNA-binding protein